MNFYRLENSEKREDIKFFIYQVDKEVASLLLLLLPLASHLYKSNADYAHTQSYVAVNETREENGILISLY